MTYEEAYRILEYLVVDMIEEISTEGTAHIVNHIRAIDVAQEALKRQMRKEESEGTDD